MQHWETGAYQEGQEYRSEETQRGELGWLK